MIFHVPPLATDVKDNVCSGDVARSSVVAKVQMESWGIAARATVTFCVSSTARARRLGQQDMTWLCERAIKIDKLDASLKGIND